MSSIDDRETPYRVARAGYGKDIWLTKREIELANLLELEAYPTQHGDIDCPAPEVCGWFITRKDYDKLKRVEAVSDLVTPDSDTNSSSSNPPSRLNNLKKGEA